MLMLNFALCATIKSQRGPHSQGLRGGPCGGSGGRRCCSAAGRRRPTSRCHWCSPGGRRRGAGAEGKRGERGDDHWKNADGTDFLTCKQCILKCLKFSSNSISLKLPKLFIYYDPFYFLFSKLRTLRKFMRGVLWTRIRGGIPACTPDNGRPAGSEGRRSGGRRCLWPPDASIPGPSFAIKGDWGALGGGEGVALK